MKIKQTHAVILFFILLAFYLYFYKFNNILEKMQNKDCNNCNSKNCVECKNKNLTDEKAGSKIIHSKVKPHTYANIHKSKNNILQKNLNVANIRTTGMVTDVETHK